MAKLTGHLLYKTLFNWPFDLMVGLTMIGLGVFVIIWPDRGISGYIQTTFSFPMYIFGMVTIMCALNVVYKPSVSRFAVFVSPLMIYAAMSIPYFLDGLINNTAGVGTTAVIVWPAFYWLINWVNNRRIELIKQTS